MAPPAAKGAGALVVIALLVWVGSRAHGGSGRGRALQPSCPVPTLPIRGDVCEAVFATRERPCVLGNHTTLCLDFPNKPISAEAFAAARIPGRSAQVRLQIINNEILIVHDAQHALLTKYPRTLLRHLRHIAGAARVVGLPDVDFLLHTGDGTPPFPVLSHAALTATPPDERTYHVPTDTGVSKWTKPPSRERCGGSASAEERADWAQRDPRLQYRGSANGPRVSLDGWWENNRARLSALSTLFPQLIDSKLTQMFGSENETEVLSHFIAIGKGMPMARAKKYRYVMHLDGNGQANRLPNLMHTGTTLVLVASKYEVHISASVHRIPHVFPIALDLSDLMVTLACLRKHEDLAFERARLGLQVARQLITYKNAVVLYWADLLEHYKRHMQFPVVRHPDAIPVAKYRFVLDGRYKPPDSSEIRELVFPYNMSLGQFADYDSL